MVDLTLNRIKSSVRAGADGADKRLERNRSLLLNLLERREIPKHRVEAVEGGQTLLGCAPCRVERVLQGNDMAFQLLEFRSPDGAELVVGIECIADERGFPVGRRDAALRSRFQRCQIARYLIEDTLDLDKLVDRETLIRKIIEQLCGFLQLLLDSRGSAGKLRVIACRKQRGAGGDDALGTLRKLQGCDGRRDRFLRDLVERLADGVEGVIADYRGGHRKGADRNE